MILDSNNQHITRLRVYTDNVQLDNVYTGTEAKDDKMLVNSLEL